MIPSFYFSFGKKRNSGIRFNGRMVQRVYKMRLIVPIPIVPDLGSIID
jgi:hypothetical protein